MDPKDRIVVALDVDSVDEAKRLVDGISPYVWGFKVGLELITAQLAGEVVHFIIESGGRVFWDGKWKDIPETVGRAAKAAAGLGVHMVNVFADAKKAAVEAAVANRGHALVLGLTILTSFDDKDCEDIYGGSVREKVIKFASKAVSAGAQGIICSPRDLKPLIEVGGFEGITMVTPGVRPEWASANDQKRIMTPGEAVKEGADLLVIGRPITKPPIKIGGPIEAIKRISDEIAAAM